MPLTLRPALRSMIAATLAVGLLGAGSAVAGPGRTAPPVQAIAAEDLGGDPSPSPQPDPTATPAATPATPELTPQPDPTPTPEPTPEPTATATPEPTATATPAPTAPPPVVPGPWSGRFNLYRSTAWVRQYTSYTCTAASAQTMLNIIRKRSDRSLLTQKRIIRYARAHDSLRFSLGTDPSGWSRALTYFGGGAYGWRTFGSRDSALRYAATRMLATGKPVGLLVWRGHHAWTMTGFTSMTDPRVNPAAVITGVYVAPPLVGVDPRPNTYLRTGSLGTFARYQERDGLRAWVGRWVVVAP